MCSLLGIKHQTVSECKQDNPGHVRQTCHAALMWWQGNADSPTWAALLKAMRDGGFKGPANEIETKLRSGTEL